jgi:predicted N-acyltransferase
MEVADSDNDIRDLSDLHNLIEPPSLVNHFLRHPPYGFSTMEIDGAVPAFITDFDLTTTLAQVPHRGWATSMLMKAASRLLRFRTCFVGTTVSEYALLPRQQAATAFVDQLMQSAADCALVIIKDIPSEPVLVSEAAMRYSGELADACQNSGFIMVKGQALAYVPLDFESIDNFLAHMTRVRRKDIKRKLRSASQLEVEAIPTGVERFTDEPLLNELYALYRNVYDQSTVHFDLLSPAFFRATLQDANSGGVVFTYKAAGQLIGYNLCFVHGGMLLDKHVGFAYPQAREHNLYFVSWFHNLQYALQRGLTCYVAGWTDPEIKRHLGARFTFTRHAVYVRNAWLRRILTHFKRHFEADAQWQQTAR